MPIEKRHGLKEQFPTPSIRSSGSIPKRREGAVREQLHDAFHQLPHVRNVRYGQDYSPVRRTCSTSSSRGPIPEYQVRWRWRPNSVAIWDNRCTQHYAVMDYWPAVRKMERAGIVGDKPY